MIKISRGFRSECHFAERPSLSFGPFCSFYSTRSTEDFFWFEREDFYTKIVRLDGDFESSFGRGCQRDIGLARRRGFQCEVFGDVEEFVRLLELFYASRQLGVPPTRTQLDPFRQHLVLTGVRWEDGQVLNLHSYIVDREGKVARLWHSIENESRTNKDVVARSGVGLANKLLHWHDMHLFAGQGIADLDFGGYAYGASDAKLTGINAFKDGFGGELVRLSHYHSVCGRLLDAARALGRRRR